MSIPNRLTVWLTFHSKEVDGIIRAKKERVVVAGPADENGQCLAVIKQKKEEEAQFLFVPID